MNDLYFTKTGGLIAHPLTCYDDGMDITSKCHEKVNVAFTAKQGKKSILEPIKSGGTRWGSFNIRTFIAITAIALCTNGRLDVFCSDLWCFIDVFCCAVLFLLGFLDKRYFRHMTNTGIEICD